MYRGYKTDERFGKYEENLLKERVFPRSYQEKTITQIIDIYKRKLINSLGDFVNEIYSMSNEVNIVDISNFYDIIISVPSFYKEETIENTIYEIRKQVKQNPNKSILLLVYNNGYKINKSSLFDIRNAGKKIIETFSLKDINNLSFVMISKEYGERPSISKIRSDMFDLLICSNISKKVDDKTIYLSFDADIRKIEDGYIKDLLKYHNSGYKIVIGNRNRTFEYEKMDDPFLYLQEKIFLLGEEMIYNRSQDRDIDTLTNGWSSSFNLKSLLLVKGYERDFDSADDVIVGHKLNRFYGDIKKNKEIAVFMEKRIWSDPSRGSDIIQKGKLFFEQRDQDVFDIREERITKKKLYKKENSIISLLLEGGTLNRDDITRLESVLKSYIEYFYGKNQYLNDLFGKELVAILKEFFGTTCIYDFVYSLEENKIFLRSVQ